MKLVKCDRCSKVEQKQGILLSYNYDTKWLEVSVARGSVNGSDMTEQRVPVDLCDDCDRKLENKVATFLKS